MTPKLLDPDYCLAQATELAAQAKSAPNSSLREMLLRVSHSYAHLATFAEVDQRNKATCKAGSGEQTYDHARSYALAVRPHPL